MRRLLFRAAGDRKGLAAVEFAFVAPVMITFFFGMFELCQALLCRSDVTNLTATASDLVAQEKSVSDTDINNVFNAAAAMLFPYDTSKATIIIASVVDNNNAGQGTVAWCNAYTNGARNDGACANGSVNYTAGNTITLPNSSLVTAGGGGSVIVANVKYSYSSAVSTYFVGNVTMTNTFYSKPRRAAQIPHT